MQDVKDFHIGTAFYFLENSIGSILKLTLNYAKNTYEIEIVLDKGNIEKLKGQAKIAANYMLAKKAQKNLRDRLLEMKIE